MELEQMKLKQMEHRENGTRANGHRANGTRANGNRVNVVNLGRFISISNGNTFMYLVYVNKMFKE